MTGWLERLRERDRRHGYGVILLLVLASACFQVAAPDESWARFVTMVLGALTLVAAMIASDAHPGLARAAVATAAGFVVLGGLVWLIKGELPASVAAIVNGLLVLFAPLLIVRGITADVRREGGVTVHALSGVLAIYLLFGMFFSFLYSAVDVLNASAFFSEVAQATRSDMLYFSYVTLSTVGYGDLAPVSDVARMLAVAEALLGQIYLVTVVALIVSNLRPRRAPRAEGQDTPQAEPG